MKTDIAPLLNLHDLLDQMELEFNRHVESYQNDFRHDVCFVLRTITSDDWNKIADGKSSLFYSVGTCGSHLGITDDAQPLWVDESMPDYRQYVHFQVHVEYGEYGRPVLVLDRVFVAMTSAKYAA